MINPLKVASAGYLKKTCKISLIIAVAGYLNYQCGISSTTLKRPSSSFGSAYIDESTRRKEWKRIIEEDDEIILAIIKNWTEWQ